MRFSLLALLALTFLSGCSGKNAFSMFKMDETYERSVEQLRSGTIVQSFETKAIATTIYLNPIYPEIYTDGEYFVGAFYFEKGYQDTKKWTLNDFGYTLKLNGKIPTSMELIKENDPRRLLIPVQNNWNRYYIIRFDSQELKALSLRLENNQTGLVELNYQK